MIVERTNWILAVPKPGFGAKLPTILNDGKTANLSAPGCFPLAIHHFGNDRDLGAVAYVQLAHQDRHMRLHGRFRDAEVECDLFVEATRMDAVQNLALCGGEVNAVTWRAIVAAGAAGCHVAIQVNQHTTLPQGHDQTHGQIAGCAGLAMLDRIARVVSLSQFVGQTQAKSGAT